MDFKNVDKSKSSMVGKTTSNKRSFSNVAFQTSVAKKRGVYVEKKIQSAIDNREAKDVLIQNKPPRRPRPGQKKFLASVLTILSKSTTGTQHPEIHDSANDNVTKFKPQCRKTNNSEFRILHRTNQTKKNKYRSRVLNDEMLQSDKEQLIILEPRKEITVTPSNNSVQIKPASDLIKLTNENEPERNAIREILEHNIVAERVTQEIFESKSKKEKKLRVNDEPETIASQIAKEDKNMYNFFVDLLEKTISVYDVRTENHNELPAVREVSRTAFEIDDAVVKKLDIKKDSPSPDNISYTSKHRYAFDVSNNLPIDLKPSVYTRCSPVKPKIKAKSFVYSKNIIREAKLAPKSKSFEINNKYNKKSNKKEIINLLKEELAKDTNTFNEPDSLYDALKVIAKNKKRNEKSIHYVNKITNSQNVLDKECMFERRTVISFGSKRKNTVRNNRKCVKDLRKSHSPSNHSLEVYGYDYEQPVKLPEVKREKRIILNYHSSPSVSELNLEDGNASISNIFGSSSSDILDFYR
ncbi:uncharacterized protein LOC120635701 isoform X1 [Pararge aegeria]|uniref:uncharacterized protein LOC120635701 isoform X1 n=2 Tax=Pararge aegeria TaxID=116150 RepID=UPI0019D2DE30|nr:uncharacterized protein LOC120635701 isoform X1 [Pararge aegeria]